MPGRGITSSIGYRYGFNGKEDDQETVGTGNGTQDYGMRIYNPSLGKFLSVDPITAKYPELTPYQFASNRPIDGIDLDGLEHFYSAEGRLIASIQNENYKDIIVTNLSYEEGMDIVNKKVDYEKQLNNHGSRAYLLFETDNIMSDWAKEWLPKSTRHENGMVIFSNTIIDDNGNKVTIVVPGSNVEGPPVSQGRGEVDLTMSTLYIGGKAFFKERPNYSGGIGSTLINPYNWARSSMIHSHWAGGPQDFSHAKGSQILGGDFEMARSWNIPSYLASPDLNYLKLFDPKNYKQNLAEEGLPSDSFDATVIEKTIQKKFILK